MLNRFKMAKHFELSIEKGRLSYQRNEQSIETEQGVAHSFRRMNGAWLAILVQFG